MKESRDRRDAKDAPVPLMSASRYARHSAHMAIVRSREALVGCRTQLVNHVPKERSNPSEEGCPSAQR
jgi:hypothetical protein